MAKPSVDGLQEELGDTVRFSRVNIKDAAGQQLARKYGVRAVPTFLVISATGEVLYKKTGGTPDRDNVLASLAPPAAP